MNQFICTFEGFATMAIEATDADDARDKALNRAIESNEIPATTKLTVREVEESLKA